MKLPNDLKHGAEGNDAFYGFSMGWPQALAILAALLCIGLVLDAIERKVEKPAPPIVAEQPQLSHPLRGPDCDITITQRDDKGQWGPERCAKGVRK